MSKGISISRDSYLSRMFPPGSGSQNSVMADTGITLDKRTELIWQAFKFYLPPGTRLSEVIRPPMAQLELIVKTAKKEGYHFKKPPTLPDRSSWEPALLFLRNKKYDIAAPGASTHGRRYAFDLAGPDLNRIAEGLLKAAAANQIHLMPPRPGWPNPKIETKNHCVHVEVDAARIDFIPFDFA